MRNGFGASSHHGPLGDTREFVMLFSASPLPNVLPTFKKLLKIGTPEANCCVSSNNRKCRKGSVSLSPSCSVLPLIEDAQQAGTGRNSLSRGWAMALLSSFPLHVQPHSPVGQGTCQCQEQRNGHE